MARVRNAGDASAGLIARENELDVARSVLAAAEEGEDAAVLVEGPAGIGKTSLLAAIRREAEERGLQVLAARGTELRVVVTRRPA